ncbi:MAG TPA: serine/threonine-protein kinase, partial [Polyangiaceae bacterium]|nr:serine/threonine-protein kinase [Polyangiaceae bacterium]
RIAALEHGLEQRGQFGSQLGDLTHSVLGGKYRMLRPVGSGGIGTVYAAEHLGLGVQVAVKVLRGAAAVDAAEVARLRREARVQMSLEHPNVVRTFDLDQMPDGTLFVVMELLRGVSLQDQLKRRRPLPPGFAIPVFLQACSALSAAHRLGIVHRDLKPGNIFLCEGGLVKVLDFGMSKLAEEETLTQDGYTLGTPEYMSPEQCVGGPIDARSDVYAFGVLMYEALTGDLPFHGKSRQALLEHHQRSTPRPMRQVRPDLSIPDELDRIVMACLKKRPSERPQTAQQLERLLAAVPPLGVLNEYPADTPQRLAAEPHEEDS